MLSQSKTYETPIEPLVIENQKPFFTFKTPKSETAEFEIQQLTYKDFQEALDMITSSFQFAEPKFVHLSVPKEEIKTMVKFWMEQAINHKLAVVTKEKITQKIGCVILYTDYFLDIQSENYKTVAAMFKKDSTIQNIIEAVGKLNFDKIHTTRPGEVFIVRYAATKMEFAEYGLLDRMSSWIWAHHPVISKYERFFVITGNEVTANKHRKLGSRVIDQVELSTFTNSKGEKVFSTLAETIKKKNLFPCSHIRLFVDEISRATKSPAIYVFPKL